MEQIVTFLLILFLVLVIHSYVLYPIIIKIISQKKENGVNNFYNPAVSIVLSAFNEDKVIRSRIENLAEQNYNFSSLEVLIGSDNSNDRTDEILLELQNKYSWLRVFLFDKRRGKAAVLNDLIENAKNEILVFTDANTQFDNNALLELVKKFQTYYLGGICGRLILQNPNVEKSYSVEEKSYWEYETVIKEAEGKKGILIGANGGIYAIRKKLFTKIPTDKAVTDDLYITLSVLSQGYQFSYNPNAVAFEEVASSIISEYKRKIRFAATNFQTIFYFKNLLFNKNILISFALWSHKIIRWFTFIFLLFIFILNVLVVEDKQYFRILLYVQCVFYLFAFSGFALRKTKLKLKIFTIPFYFLMTNVAMFIGLLKFIFKKHKAYWQSTPRS